MCYPAGMSGDFRSDTHPDIEARFMEACRAMPPARKFEIVCALTRTVHELALIDIRRCHPDASPRELALRLASRCLEPGLLKDALGWDVSVEGY